jgi:hypothetical protein
MNPMVAWMLWISTWHLGASKLWMDIAEQMEGDED